MAVIDTGVDFTRFEFGACAAAGPSCVVTESLDMELFDDGAEDDNGHGTLMAGIIHAIAPEARIISLDAASNGVISDSRALSALEWVLANATQRNIRAVTLGFGSGQYVNACLDTATEPNPYQRVVNELRRKNVLVIAASGNDADRGDGRFRPGLARPACTPGIVAAGAVYTGSPPFAIPGVRCTDPTPAVNQIPCFSQTGSTLKLLAPGGHISSVIPPPLSSADPRLRLGGTSLAAAHIAGAAAAIASAGPALRAGAIQNILETTGRSITDRRNGTRQRLLNLPRALCSVTTLPNDQALRAQNITGPSGKVTLMNGCATKDPGDFDHGGSAGGRSVWYRWVAPTSGSITFKSSGIDTLLAVMTLEGILLKPVATNDDFRPIGGASAVTFHAQQGTAYLIALDDKPDLILPGFRFRRGGLIQLEWSRYINDAFIDAQLLTTRTTSADNLLATREADEPVHCSAGGGTLWYRWTAPNHLPAFIPPILSPARIALRVEGKMMPACVTVYTGTKLTALTRVAGNRNSDQGPTSVAEFNAVAGTSYVIAVESPRRDVFTLQFDRRIAFTSNRDGNNEIYSVFADGTGLQRLTNSSADDSGPAWSPDGLQIAFSSDRHRPGNREIYVMDHDGSNVRRVTDNPTTDLDSNSNPAWSDAPIGIVGIVPYGGIAFESDRDGTSHIWIVQSDGLSPPHRASINLAEERNPAWFPYVGTASFSLLTGGPGGLSHFDVHATPQAGPSVSQPYFWTPSDDLGHDHALGIDFVGTVRNRRGSQIWIQRPGHPRVIVSGGPNPTDRDPAWDSFGYRVAFTTTRTGNDEIFVVDADGKNLRNVTTHPAADTDSSWSGTSLFPPAIFPRAP